LANGNRKRVVSPQASEKSDRNRTRKKVLVDNDDDFVE